MHQVLVVLQFLVSLRVPLLGAAFLIAFPFVAFRQGRTLLLGLFDQTPWSLFLVTLAVYCLAGTVADNAHLIATQAAAGPREMASWARSHGFGAGTPESRLLWLAAIVLLALPTLYKSIWLSRRQGWGTGRLAASAIAGLGIGTAVAWVLMAYAVQPLQGVATRAAAGSGRLAAMLRAAGHGNDTLYAEHVLALCALGAALVAWTIFGVYGYSQLGKPKTVPALAALLMLVMTAMWPLAGATFYLDHWHIPTLLIAVIVAWAVANGWSRGSDHTYVLIDAANTPAPSPAEVLTATGARRVIVAAAEGGGILAAAWTAQVLEGLRTACGAAVFDPALRMISGVSGGSVGTAFYVDWLLNPATARRPSVSAAKSSLDEVAWGLAWPDCLRAVAPWLCGWMIDRGTALERAWSRNCAQDPRGGEPRLLGALSGWREKAAEGTIPGVVLNATVVENGFRLLMSTSEMERCLSQNARIDASEVNRLGDRQMDVSGVTAARLSATFSWVTPAARAAAGRGSRKPHVVDGGYYDNYGMATLVEWLDEALSGTLTGADGEVTKVLVLQIHSAPPDSGTVQNGNVMKGDTRRGWFFQLMAPAQTLLNVRSSGQIAHNDIELGLLQQKWASRGVEIESAAFTFPGTNPPLSWHLTQEQKQEVRDAWAEKMSEPIAKVEEFLGVRAAGAPGISLAAGSEGVAGM